MKPLLPARDLARYANAVVRVGLSLGEGDRLIVLCQPAHRELAVALVAAGYGAGCDVVDVAVNDPLVRAARLRSAPKEKLGLLAPWQAARLRATVTPNTVTLLIAGESEPGALDGIPADRVAEEQTAPLRALPQVRRAVRAGRRRWGIIGWPTPAWAAQVFPKLEPEAAQRRLARDLLAFCRLGPKDPPGVAGLREHLTQIQRRARRLTQLKLRRVELRGPGTELSVSLHPDTLWSGGGGKNAFGIYQAPNLPTEECFTSPEAAATEGTFRCSRPLMFQGRLIDGLAGEFRRGRLLRLAAKRDADRDWFAGFLHGVDGADRLGEVALVDRSSRIGQARRIFYNTLLDENAAAHIAFGSSFQHTRRARDGAVGRRGLNTARIHVDVMIGSDDLEATGIAGRGRRVPLIADGLWQV